MIARPSSSLPGTVARAIFRARHAIATVAVTYGISVLVGGVMVHSGNSFALSCRDRLVKTAAQKDPASRAALRGDRLRAALLDFARNLALGAMPKSIAGLGVAFPYAWVAHQGWIGGIVSIRGDHTSRLNDLRSAAYYLLTLVLQLTAYSLAVGAGVNVGLALFRPPPYYQGTKWLGIFPAESLRDLVRIYLAVIPLFLAGSLWEFFSPWNL